MIDTGSYDIIFYSDKVDFYDTIIELKSHHAIWFRGSLKEIKKFFVARIGVFTTNKLFIYSVTRKPCHCLVQSNI